jgi:hypothetical protein
MGDSGCLHVGAQHALRWAHTRARCNGARAGEADSRRHQREGDTELRSLSLALVQEGEVVRCRAEEATRWWCV